MSYPRGRIDENRILEFDLELQVSIRMPRNNRTNSGCKQIDHDADSADHVVGEKMRKRIDANVAIFTASSHSSHHCEPEHNQPDQFVRPNDAGTEDFPEHDLSDCKQHHAA